MGQLKDFDNRARIKYLRERLKMLENEIVSNHRQTEFIDYLDQIRLSPNKAIVIDEEGYDIQLPQEKEHNLIFHYHTLRVELTELLETMDGLNSSTLLESWLNKRWAKTTISVASIIGVASTILQVLKLTGLLLMEEKDESNNNLP